MVRVSRNNAIPEIAVTIPPIINRAEEFPVGGRPPFDSIGIDVIVGKGVGVRINITVGVGVDVEVKAGVEVGVICMVGVADGVDMGT